MKAKRFIRAGTCLLLLAIFRPVYAQGFDDPTRPPAAFLDPGMAQVAPPVVAGVTSIKIGPGRKRSAIVYGVPANLGDAVGDAILSDVSESGVALRHADGTTERLFLYESIEKRPVSPAVSKAGAMSQRGQR